MSEMSPRVMDALAQAVRKLKALLEADLSRQAERRFRLSVPLAQAGLAQREFALRERLQAWLEERARARLRGSAPTDAALREVRQSAESELAHTWLLRLCLLRQLEACGVSRPAVLTGGWSSKGYLEFRSHAPALAASSEYEGFELLLELVFDELAVDLPGIYGPHPLEPYFMVSATALRTSIGVLDAEELEGAWQDDTALGWVYQFWNDPRREAIDERVGPRGRIGVHEIASKTQLFSERYMVDWLLQNSVGRIVLGMQRAQSSSSAGSDGARSGSAGLGWSMFVDRAAALAGEGLPSRLEELRILDPACGSGHFLAGAFDLLLPLYRRQDRELGEEADDERIAERILRHNLHGVDIDSRAVQVAAAVLFLKAKRLSRRGRVPPMNLVSASFDLDHLEKDDPALMALVQAMPEQSRDLERLIDALRHIGFRGSLMRFGRLEESGLLASADAAAELERFIAARTQASDLGVRFDGTQLAAGLRLQKLLVDGRYDVVAFNPPYLATSKIELPPRLWSEAFADTPDLFAAFVERALELCKPTGLIAFVALSNWMFLSSFQKTRERLLRGQILLLADVGKGAFRRASKLIQTAMVVASPTQLDQRPSLAARVGSRDAISATQAEDIARALEDANAYTEFDPAVFTRIDGSPLLIWLDAAFLRRYGELPKLEDVADGSGGIATTDNERFLRAVWEVPESLARAAETSGGDYVPYLKGAEGREWLEPFRWLLRVAHGGLELRLLQPSVRLARASTLGVAYTTIGHRFGTRVHTVRSVRDVSGASVFPGPEVTVEDLVCALNRTPVRELACALNPTVNFQLGDVRRLPFDRVAGSQEIVATLRRSFAEAERANELSLEYQGPSGTSWRAAKAWAQRAVDREAGSPLPVPHFETDAPAPWQWLSHGLGVALGRFRAEGGLATSGEGALPAGILFLGPRTSALEHPACRPLLEAWDAFGRELAKGGDLGAFLRKEFFALHRAQYEGRPIFLPLSSSKRSYVAYVCIHRFAPETLSVLLAEHLLPERRRAEGELFDLRRAKLEGGPTTSIEKRLLDVHKSLDELNRFILDVSELAEKGPPPADEATQRREVDAPFVPELGDGVVVNSAALWPLLDPQWKEPKKWWKDLANAQGKKNYDWSRLAARYFPDRVRHKCATDPSLAVAHECFWELHPEAAYAWELRLQRELGPSYTLDEPAAETARAEFLRQHPERARQIFDKEQKRRARKQTQ